MPIESADVVENAYSRKRTCPTTKIQYFRRVLWKRAKVQSAIDLQLLIMVLDVHAIQLTLIIGKVVTSSIILDRISATAKILKVTVCAVLLPLRPYRRHLHGHPISADAVRLTSMIAAAVLERIRCHILFHRSGAGCHGIPVTTERAIVPQSVS